VRSELQQRLERLEATRAGVVARIEDVDRTTLNRPRADGGWSVLQVLHHVIVAESGTLRYIPKKMLGGTSLPRAGLVSRLRRLTLQAAFVSPLRFRAPGVTADVPNEIDPAELIARWGETRGGWRRLLDEFPEEILDRMVFRHGMVGLMGLRDTLAFLQGHLDHHVRQVERLLARP
jgi:hypothetical protein